MLQAAGGGREVEAVVAWAGRFGVGSLHLHAHAAPADGKEVARAVTEAWVVWSLLGRQWLWGEVGTSGLAEHTFTTHLSRATKALHGTRHDPRTPARSCHL